MWSLKQPPGREKRHSKQPLHFRPSLRWPVSCEADPTDRLAVAGLGSGLEGGEEKAGSPKGQGTAPPAPSLLLHILPLLQPAVGTFPGSLRLRVKSLGSGVPGPSPCPRGNSFPGLLSLRAAPALLGSLKLPGTSGRVHSPGEAFWGVPSSCCCESVATVGGTPHLSRSVFCILLRPSK